MTKAKKPTKRTTKKPTKPPAIKAKTPRDWHASVAAKMFGVPLNKVSLSQRDLVKKVYYLHQYGGTVPHFPFVTNPPTANAVVPAWRTKDGRVIPVSTMSDAHLANAMAMLYRKLGPLMAEANKRAQECHEVRSGGAVDSCLSDVDFGDLF
jgi:hypothetical protein